MPATPLPPKSDLAAWADIGIKFVQLFELVDSAMLFRDGNRYSLSAMSAKTIQRIIVTGNGPQDLVATALEKFETDPTITKRKRCPRCELVKPLDQFAKSRVEKDGLWRYCKKCERERVKNYDARQG